MYVVWQVVGTILFVIGAQGAIRLLLNDSWLLGWLPGGFWVQLICFLAISVGGVFLLRWGREGAKRADQAKTD